MPNKKIPTMADVNFVDNFDAMVLDQNPRRVNTEWIAEAMAATSPLWKAMAEDLTADLLAEGKALGLIKADTDPSSEPNQSDKD